MPYDEKMQAWKKDNAREMRSRMTKSEAALWQHLKGRRDVAWFAQVPMLGYIADFWCPDRQLVVEVDGGVHIGREDYDGQRDSVMRKHGIHVIRFSDTEVLGAALCCAEEACAVALAMPLKTEHRTRLPEAPAWKMKQGMGGKKRRGKFPKPKPAKRLSGVLFP